MAKRRITRSGDRDPFAGNALQGATPRGTGNHPTNNIRSARSTRDAYTTQITHGGQRGTVTLPPVRHQEVAGSHGNRMTMTNTMDTVGHGGYRQRLVNEANKRFGTGHQSLALRNEYINAGMERHHEASIEAKRRKYPR
jgi:hypothetical protein